MRRIFNDCAARGIGEGSPVADITSFLYEEYPCDEFKQYTKLSPREHREMLDRQWQLEQENLRETDRRTFEQHLAEMSTKPQWWMVGLSVGSMVIALASLAVAALAVLH